jgi:hypothetical protein
MSLTTTLFILGALVAMCLWVTFKLKKRVDTLEKRCNEEFRAFKEGKK